jgi:hypothetical protein
MIQVILPFLTSISLAAVAAYFSILGLTQIFPGSFWPIVIMGSIIEIGKLVTVSWLYNNWKESALYLKVYFLSAIFVIMIITSMGIFGYLSKSHIESNIVVGVNTVELQSLTTQEKIVTDRLNYLLEQSEKTRNVTPRMNRDILATQNELKSINEKKLPLLKEENLLLAEIGPIKYVAEMFYGNSDPSFIDKAVRVVILFIIFVFDPLAILLLVAANQTYKRVKKVAVVENHIDKVDGGVIQYETGDGYEVIPKDSLVKFKKDGDCI